MIKVTFKYDFEFDDSGFDPKSVDIIGLAKDEAFRSLKQDISDGGVTSDDFIVDASNTIDIRRLLNSTYGTASANLKPNGYRIFICYHDPDNGSHLGYEHLNKLYTRKNNAIRRAKQLCGDNPQMTYVILADYLNE